MFKKDYKFDEAFNLFDKIHDKCNKHNEYRPKSDNNINNKDAILEYLQIIENKIIHLFSTPSTGLKINNVNYKGYVDARFENVLKRLK